MGGSKKLYSPVLPCLQVWGSKVTKGVRGGASTVGLMEPMYGTRPFYNAVENQLLKLIFV